MNGRFLSFLYCDPQNDLCRQQDAIDAKIEGVNSLVSMLGCRDVEKMSVTFEAMSSSPDNCELMRSNRVVPVLIGVLHGGNGHEVTCL